MEFLISKGGFGGKGGKGKAGASDQQMQAAQYAFEKVNRQAHIYKKKPSLDRGFG